MKSSKQHDTTASPGHHKRKKKPKDANGRLSREESLFIKILWLSFLSGSSKTLDEILTTLRQEQSS